MSPRDQKLKMKEIGELVANLLYLENKLAFLKEDKHIYNFLR